MTRVPDVDAAAVIDPMLDAVRGALEPNVVAAVERYRAAGEWGAVIRRIVLSADANNITLPDDRLRIVAGWLDNRSAGFFPPALPMDDVERSVKDRLATTAA